MKKEIFIEKMKEILDCSENFTFETKLSEIEEWDSLSIVSFLAMANVESGKKIDITLLREAKSIGDLYILIKS